MLVILSIIGAAILAQEPETLQKTEPETQPSKSKFIDYTLNLYGLAYLPDYTDKPYFQVLPLLNFVIDFNYVFNKDPDDSITVGAGITEYITMLVCITGTNLFMNINLNPMYLRLKLYTPVCIFFPNFLLMPLWGTSTPIVIFSLIVVPELYIGFKLNNTSHMGFCFTYLPEAKELAPNIVLFGWILSKLYMFGIYYSFK